MPYPPAKRRRKDASPKNKQKRANRVAARRQAIKRGMVKGGDGKDVHHLDGNTSNNAYSNLQILTRRQNRRKN